VPDTDSISAVPGQNAIGRQPVGNAPAKEYSLAIARGYTASKDRPLGAASGMESEVGVIYRLAALKLDIITNLKAETVSIIVTGNNILETPLVAILDKDTAGEVAVNVLVFITVTIEHYIFHNNIVHILSSQDWKNSSGRSIFFNPKVLFGQTVQIENIPFNSRNRGTQYIILPVSRAFFGTEHYPSSGHETFYIFDLNAVFEPVRIPQELRHNAIGFSKYGPLSRASQCDIRMKVNCISQIIYSRQNVKCPSTDSVQVLNPGLDYLVVIA
jgi:hypothetical protein